MAAHIDDFLTKVSSSDDAERVIAYLTIGKGYTPADLLAMYRGDADFYVPELVAYFNNEQALKDKLDSIGLRLSRGTFWIAPTGSQYNFVFSELTKKAFTDGANFDDINHMIRMFDRIIWTKELWKVGPDYWYNTFNFWLKSVEEQKGIFLSDEQINIVSTYVRDYVFQCWDNNREPFQTDTEYREKILSNWGFFVPGQLQAVVEQAVDRATHDYVWLYIQWYTNSRPVPAICNALSTYIDRFGTKDILPNKIINEVCGRVWNVVPSQGKWALTASENPSANFLAVDGLYSPVSIRTRGYVPPSNNVMGAPSTVNTLSRQKIVGGFKVSPSTAMRAQSVRYFLNGREIAQPTRAYSVGGQIQDISGPYIPSRYSNGPTSYDSALTDFSLPLAVSYYGFTSPATGKTDLIRNYVVRPASIAYHYCVAEHYDIKINRRATSKLAERAGGVSAPASGGSLVMPSIDGYPTAGDIAPGTVAGFEARYFANYPHLYSKILKAAYFLCRYPQLQAIEMPEFTKETDVLKDKFWKEIYIGEDNCITYFDKIIEIGTRFATRIISGNDFVDVAEEDTVEIVYKSFSDAPGLGFLRKVWKEIKRFGRRLAAEFKRIVKQIERALSNFLQIVIDIIYYTIMAVVAVVALVVVAIPAAVLALHALYVVVLQVIAALYWAIYAAWQLVVAAIAYIYEQVIAIIAARVVEFIASEFVTVPDITVPEPEPWAPPPGAGSGLLMPALLALAGGGFLVTQLL